MALADHALTDVTAAMGALGLETLTASERTYIEMLIHVASDLFTEATNVAWHRVAGHVEKVSGDGSHILRLTDYAPLVSISSITYEGDPIDSSEYGIGSARQGEIVRKNGGWADTSRVVQHLNTHRIPASDRTPYEVTYTAGFVTPQQATDGLGQRDLPYDIEQAVLDYVVSRYAQRGRDQMVSSIKVLDGSIAYVKGSAVPQQFAHTVNRYRRRSFA